MKLHPDLAASLLALGEFRPEQGETSRAEELVREGIEVQEATLPPNHWSQAYARTLFGSCLAARGQFQEAEPLLLDGYGALQAAHGAKDRNVQTTLRRLISFLRSLGSVRSGGRVVSRVGDVGTGNSRLTLITARHRAWVWEPAKHRNSSNP